MRTPNIDGSRSSNVHRNMEEQRVLFLNFEMAGLIQNRQTLLQADVESIDADSFLNTSADDLSEYLSDKYQFEIPVLDRERAVADQYESHALENDRSGRTFTRTRTIIEVTVPFSGDAQMFYVSPPTSDAMPPRARLDGNTVVLSMPVDNSDAAAVRGNIQRLLDTIDRYLDWQRPAANRFNEGSQR